MSERGSGAVVRGVVAADRARDIRVSPVDRTPSAGAPPLGLEQAGGIGGLLAMQDVASGEDYVVLYDANGNVGQLVAWAADYQGAAGNGWHADRLVARYEYDPYGNVIGPDTNGDGLFGEQDQPGPYAVENPFRFSTKYYDGETDLYYYGYRYYAPGLGRWLNRDPHAEVGGNNLYAYASNAPPLSVDPLGLVDVSFNVSVETSIDHANAATAAFLVRVRADTNCCYCSTIKWVQIVKDRAEFNFWGGSINLGTNNKWIIDGGTWYTKDYWFREQIAFQDGREQCVQSSYVDDEPGPLGRGTLVYLEQEFEMCAICVRYYTGAEKERISTWGKNGRLCVLGCYKWYHVAIPALNVHSAAHEGRSRPSGEMMRLLGQFARGGPVYELKHTCSEWSRCN